MSSLQPSVNLNIEIGVGKLETYIDSISRPYLKNNILLCTYSFFMNTSFYNTNVWIYSLGQVNYLCLFLNLPHLNEPLWTDHRLSLGFCFSVQTPTLCHFTIRLSCDDSHSFAASYSVTTADRCLDNEIIEVHFTCIHGKVLDRRTECNVTNTTGTIAYTWLHDRAILIAQFLA